MHTAESNFSNFVNWNQIQNYFSLFIRGLDGLESWEKKTGGQKSRDTLPLKNV